MKAFMLALFLLLLVQASVCTGVDQPSATPDTQPDFDVTEMVKLSNSTQALLDLMESVDKMPSCQKLATAAMVNSCSSLNHKSTLSTDHGVDFMLEKAQSIYATRLAVCELIDVNAPIPDACNPFRPTQRNTRKTGFGGFFNNNGPTDPVPYYKVYEDETLQHLDLCASSLASKPQWWTSYSNARQNSLMWCYATRAEIERENALYAHKAMHEANINTAVAMKTATEEFQRYMDNFQLVQQGMQAFQVNLNKDFDEMRDAVTAHWALIRENMVELDGSVNRVLHNTNQAAVDLAVFNEQSQVAHGQAVGSMIELLGNLDNAKDVAIAMVAYQVQLHQAHEDFMNKLHASEELAMQERVESANAQMEAHVKKAKDSVDGTVAQFTNALFASLANITDMVRKYLTRFTTIFVAPTAIVFFMTGHTILGSISVGLAVAIPLSLVDLGHIRIPAVNIYDFVPHVTTIVGWLIPIISFLMYLRLARAQQNLEVDVEDQDLMDQDVEDQDVEDQDAYSEAEHEDTAMEAIRANPEVHMENRDVTSEAKREVIPMEAGLPMQEPVQPRPVHLALNDVQHLVRRRT